jgi:hypothetical protein
MTDEKSFKMQRAWESTTQFTLKETAIRRAALPTGN